MEIVCSTDNNYVMPTGVMLTSLFENNKGESVNVHLLHDGISDVQRGNIESIAVKYGQSIHFYRMDDDAFKDFPVGMSYQNSHVGPSMATYYRLFLTRILPDSIDKVIYLDGDILVLGSLRGMWDTDISGKAVAAVPDSYSNGITHFNRLRYPQRDGYFNAGSLLINLRYWREHDMLGAFLDYVRRYPERLSYHDQDVLNVILRDVKTELPFKYNMLDEYWFDVRYSMVSWEYEQNILDGQKSPVVVHFTCVPKPWYRNCKHPYKKVFDRYRSLTVWSGMRERRWLPLSYFIEKICIRLIVMVGLRKPDYMVENRYIGI